MEVIQPHMIAPWEERLPATISPGIEETINIANTICGIRITTSSSARKGIVRIGGAIHDTLGIVTGREPTIYSVTLGVRTEQDPYTAELAATTTTSSRKTDHYHYKQSRSPAGSEPTKTSIRTKQH
jgi:hypothetical protein